MGAGADAGVGAGAGAGAGESAVGLPVVVVSGVFEEGCLACVRVSPPLETGFLGILDGGEAGLSSGDAMVAVSGILSAT